MQRSLPEHLGVHLFAKFKRSFAIANTLLRGPNSESPLDNYMSRNSKKAAGTSDAQAQTWNSTGKCSLYTGDIAERTSPEMPSLSSPDKYRTSAD